ncbi:unnamed protein product [Linum trigynum]|uniref:Uncharacterized protein n=1 Tax=Linum trigynum TaxID=586398 RepID=A0AAV2D7C7_9ROSI
MVRVITAAFRKRRIETRPNSQTLFHDTPNEDDEETGEKTEEFSAPNNSKLSRTTRLRCFAAIIVDLSKIEEQGKASNPWRLCTLQQVEGLKLLVVTFQVWVSGIACLMLMDH